MSKARKQERMEVHDSDQAACARVSVEESFEAAKLVHEAAVASRSREGLAKARRLYERLLLVAPDHTGAHHLLGLVAGQLGDYPVAIESLRRAIELSPNADAWNNLGMAYHGSGSIGEAEDAWRQALLLDPEHSDSLDNLGTILKKAGRFQEALELCEAAVANNPHHGPSHHNLAHVLQRMGRTSDAIVHYRKAVELDPNESNSRKLLGLALWDEGMREEAIEASRKWLEHDPNDPFAAHTYAAMAGVNVPPRAGDDYVRSVFDQYAPDFDEHLLGDLGYQVPRLIGERVDREHPELVRCLDVLDVGCGTGLCGARLRAHAKQLVGVDLSPAMLQMAAETGSYDELAQAELTGYLARTADSFDLIVSADTFCYFGDLLPVLQAAFHASRDQGALLFTVEEAVDEPASGFALLPHGRYVHGAGYLDRALAVARWTLASMERVELRKEAGEPVKGLLVYARRSPPLNP